METKYCKIREIKEITQEARTISTLTHILPFSPRATINGVTGRVLEKKEAFKSKHADLPAYAKTSDIYFAPGPDGKASQAKLYSKDKRMVLDFDWNHSHTNPDGTNFPKGTVHIQEYKVTKVKNKNGKWVDKYTRLSKKARRMTPAEI